MTEAARKAKGGKAENYAVIRADEARPNAKADERTAAEKADAVTREAQNTTAKAEGVSVANEAAKRQAAKDIETEL